MTFYSTRMFHRHLRLEISRSVWPPPQSMVALEALGQDSEVISLDFADGVTTSSFSDSRPRPFDVQLRHGELVLSSRTESFFRQKLLYCSSNRMEIYSGCILFFYCCIWMKPIDKHGFGWLSHHVCASFVHPELVVDECFG